MDGSIRVQAAAIGRGVFVDLWALLGFELLPCEDPLEVESILKTVGQDIGVLLAEEGWFKKMPERVKKIASHSIHPVWVLLPDMEAPTL